MKFGLYLPNIGQETSARMLADLAAVAKEFGWDGSFPLKTGDKLTLEDMHDIKKCIEE